MSGLLENENNANDKREPQTVPSPRNCKTPCPYGRAREFCWPCYAQLMKKNRRDEDETNENEN